MRYVALQMITCVMIMATTIATLVVIVSAIGSIIWYDPIRTMSNLEYAYHLACVAAACCGCKRLFTMKGTEV